MTISVQIVVDNCPPEMLDRALLYLQRTKQPSVGITAGAQLDIGMQYVERVRRELPDITILWRNLEIEDTGILLKYGAGFVYNKKVLPHLNWFKRNQVVFVPDNETSGDDSTINRYVKEVCEIGILLHSENLRGAFCRFATGNIADGSQPGQSNQYPLLKPIFSIMLPGDYISPNEYSAQPGYPGGSAGHLERYKRMYVVAGRELPTIIGEAGIAMNYDPGKGYIDAGMSAEQMAQQLLDEEIWYFNGKIARHVYQVGGFTHEGYRLTPAAFDYWEKHYREHPIVITPPVPPKPPEPTLPADLGNSLSLIVKESGWRIRGEPNDNGTVIGHLIEGEEIRLYPATTVLANGKNWKVVERLIPRANEASKGWSAIPTPPQPPAPPPPNPINIIALKEFRTRTQQTLDEIGRIALKLATYREDTVKDLQLLDAVIASLERTTQEVIPS